MWIATGWPEGGTAAQMAAVGACIMASTDNPLSNLLGFIQYTLLSVCAVFLYNFAILPSVDGFPALVLVLAPYFIALGVLLSVPTLYGFALPMIVNGAMLLGLQNQFSADFVAFANNTIATVLGLIFPAVIIAFLSSSGAEHAIDRLLTAGRNDVAMAVRNSTPLNRDTLARRMLDRIGLLVPLARDAVTRKSALREAANDYIVGVNVTDLRRLSISLAGSTQRAVTGAVAAIGEVYASRKNAPTSNLAYALSQIDEALGAIEDSPITMSTHDEASVALFEIRLALFPDAPPLTMRRTHHPRLGGRSCGASWRHIDRDPMTIGETDIYGVFVPTLFLFGLLALFLTTLLARFFRRVGFYRYVWHSALFNLLLFIIILGGVTALASSILKL